MAIPFQYVTILAVCRDEQGVIRIPSEREDCPGLLAKFDAKKAISATLRQYLANYLNKPELESHIKVLTSIDPLLTLSGKEKSRLYLTAIEPERFVAPKTWLTMPALLRTLDSGTNRTVYNKAFQVMAGALEHEFDVLEVDEEVRHRLENIDDPDQKDHD